MITFTKVALPYGWLGNMSPHPIEYGGLTWRTSEHLFQALRFQEDSPIRETIRMSKSPMGAKMAAKKFKLEMVVTPRMSVDLANMRTCLRLKVEQHSDLQGLLLATGDEVIAEDVSNRPNFAGLYWGMAKQPDGTWTGENWLGKLWMELRESLR